MEAWDLELCVEAVERDGLIEANDGDIEAAVSAFFSISVEPVSEEDRSQLADALNLRH